MNTISLPGFSIIMPVHDGIRTIDRAMESLLRQQYVDWEMLAVDDGSTDGSYERLQEWSRKDRRIRVLRMGSNRGPSAARNAGLRCANGRMVAYLDCDDEYYSDFLENAARLQGRSDVIIFGYDYMIEGDDQSKIQMWDPTPYRKSFFEGNVSTPLGVVHRHELWTQVGGFDESLWCLEDWEFWKKLARTGAEFLFVPLRSGLYRFRKGSRSHSPRITEIQRRQYESNWEAGRPLYDSVSPPACPSARGVVFVAPHTFVDACNPLGVAAAGLLDMLARSGIACQAYCPVPSIDGAEDELGRELDRRGLPHQCRDSVHGMFAARVTYSRLGRIPISFIRPTAIGPDDVAGGSLRSFLAFFDKFIDANRPDVLVTFSETPDTDPLIRVARRRDISVVLPMFDAPFSHRMDFAHADYCLVCSEIARRRYWQELEVACCKLPPAIDRDRVYAEQRDPRYLSFIAPLSGRGIFAFARIAEQLAQRRPDIPIMVVNGSTRPLWYEVIGFDRNLAERIHTMTNACDPRDYYAVTRLLVVPWLGDLPLGMSAAEAMINGIPVLVSHRGSLPEIVGAAGYVLDLPTELDASTGFMPQPHEVGPWVETIIRLWDDSDLYRRSSMRAQEHARQWEHDRVGPIYSDFFRRIRPQPGPPFIPAG